MLELKNVRAGYGEAVVLEDISLELPASGSLAVLGRNGVGKSTLLLTIMGYTRLHQGSMVFQGQDIAGLPAHRRAQLGIGWVAQEREIFPSLSLEENLTVAARPGRWDLEAVYKLFPRLRERRRNMGNQLSGGEQQMLAIARALMTNPSLLLLDEPLEGLAPIIVEELVRGLRRMIVEEGTAVILVEHDVGFMMEHCDRIVALQLGAILAEGTPEEIRQNRAVRDAYLG